MTTPNPLTTALHAALDAALMQGIALGSHGELVDQGEALAAYMTALDNLMAVYLAAGADLAGVSA